MDMRRLVSEKVRRARIAEEFRGQKFRGQYTKLTAYPRSVVSPRMARLPRIVIPGVAHHVTQRGNRRLPVFFCDGDRRE